MTQNKTSRDAIGWETKDSLCEDSDSQIRDTRKYSQDLEQDATSIELDLRNMLIEGRRVLDKAEIDSPVKGLIIQQFNNLTEELKNGDAKNSRLVNALWGMIYGGLNAVTTSPATLASLDKLKRLIDKKYGD